MKTAGVTCRFLNLGSDVLLSDCCNKADPWRVLQEVEAEITIREKKETIDIKNLDILAEEYLDGYFNTTYVDKQGMLYLTLETHKKEVLLCWKVDYENSIINLIADHTHTAGYYAFEHVGTIIPGILLKYQLGTMHGVLMEYKESGIILTADSGVGKTTHARLWRDYKRALILNGDRITFGKKDGRWIGYGLPWSGSSGEQINRSVPIQAIVQIVRAEENRVERLEGMEAFSLILGQLLTPSWDRSLADCAIKQAADMLEDIPVWCLFCKPEKEAVDVLEKALFP